jgi:DNA invertase Pin-like site-specific DNA recombinase
VYEQVVTVRLVGYPRVSTRGQIRADVSLPNQDREIRAWARRKGHRIVGMFPEGRSGALDLDDRVALTAAVDMIAAGKAEGLVCYSLDRLAREITVQEAILAAVWEAGGRVFTTDHGEVLQDDPDDPMRTGMRKMAGIMYELDRLFVVARLRRGRRLKAEQGGFAGGGIRYGFTTERKQLVPDQAERQVARRIRRLHRGACPSARSPTSSTLSRSQPSAAGLAPHHRRPSPPKDNVNTFWQAVIAALPVLVAGRIAWTRTSRLQRTINRNLDLLGRLPAEHSNRVALEAHNGSCWSCSFAGSSHVSGRLPRQESPSASSPG